MKRKSNVRELANDPPFVIAILSKRQAGGSTCAASIVSALRATDFSAVYGAARPNICCLETEGPLGRLCEEGNVENTRENRQKAYDIWTAAFGARLVDRYRMTILEFWWNDIVVVDSLRTREIFAMIRSLPKSRYVVAHVVAHVEDRCRRVRKIEQLHEGSRRPKALSLKEFIDEENASPSESVIDRLTSEIDRKKRHLIHNYNGLDGLDRYSQRFVRKHVIPYLTP